MPRTVLPFFFAENPAVKAFNDFLQQSQRTTPGAINPPEKSSNCRKKNHYSNCGYTAQTDRRKYRRHKLSFGNLDDLLVMQDKSAENSSKNCQYKQYDKVSQIPDKIQY
jgi:hypothetical protein